MSVKTCQLCGKPLSRLRVGADPEFCSKEHRNQFRLRRGMDRLVEVNKVANLMRRRESPKQIAFSSLMCQSAIAPRGFCETERTSIHTTPFQRTVSYEAFASPHITGHADTCLLPHIRRYSGQKQIRRPNVGKIRICNLDSRPALPDGNWAMGTQITQAPPRELHHRMPAHPERREFKLLRPSGIRVHVGKGPSALRRVPFTATEGLRQGIREPGVGSIAAKGNALRVSVGKRFPVPRTKVRAFLTAPEMRSAMVVSGAAIGIVPQILDCTAASRLLPPATTAIALRIPMAPGTSYTAQFRPVGALPAAIGSAMGGSLPPARSTDVGWKPAGATWKLGASPEAAGFARRNGTHLKRLAMMPNGVAPAPQVTFSPFLPQEPKGCPVVPFQAVIAGGSTGPGPAAVPTLSNLPEAPDLRPVPKRAAVAVHYEEQFAGGWDNWVGGVEDWPVDVAGVRTGSLAIFMPTLDLTDYELEFLGRIDSKTINWVVRATNLENHILCTLRLCEGNQLEFSRTAVIGGAAEQPVVAATRVTGKKRAALTIHSSVSGDSFAVQVDGNTIDTWTEDRLLSGGVGFMGTPDDRARLYWVKVSSQSTGKE
ncbi:MAG TPA: hypothetical protein VMH28_20925 [Candidatus Acidoferrales bacterium]|nr:hypothetical protein [Candidatus Acidoferrales bacterium]